MEYKQAIARQLSPCLPDIPSSEIIDTIEQPSNAQMGHFAYPCFRLAKTMRKAPPAIASEIAEKLKGEALPDWLDNVEAAGGYINFYLNKPAFADRVLSAVRRQDKNYGAANVGAGKVVTIDYSSPNTAKHFHVGHLGSTVIGHALYNILKFLGYEVISINYIGDWGTSFGKLLTAYMRWGSKEEINELGINGLTALYVRFHEEAENDPALEDEAREWVVKMENNDSESIEIWKWMCAVSMREYNKTYERLGISFDSYRGESYYNDKMDATVEELREKGLLVESDGAQLVDLEEYKMPPCLILRRDGGTLYATRDITAAKDRYNTYRFDKSLYVVASEQNLYFSQIFKVVELMGYPWAKDMAHINYGMYSFESGRLSTRKGQVIKMVDLINESVAKTLEIINEKSPNLDNKEKIAEQVGVGAVIFNAMYNNRIKDVSFSWERMLNFEGETGPYVQYTHARACSVLEKAGSQVVTVSHHLTDDESFEVLRLLYNFPERVVEAADKYEPFIISRHLVALAQAFNKFYNTHQILTGDETQASRLALVSAVKTTIENGLKLLGISAPKKM